MPKSGCSRPDDTNDVLITPSGPQKMRRQKTFLTMSYVLTYLHSSVVRELSQKSRRQADTWASAVLKGLMHGRDNLYFKWRVHGRISLYRMLSTPVLGQLFTFDKPYSNTHFCKRFCLKWDKFELSNIGKAWTKYWPVSNQNSKIYAVSSPEKVQRSNGILQVKFCLNYYVFTQIL